VVGTTVDFEQILERDRIAVHIAERYNEWNTLRSGWLADRRELRNYIFATDTSTTTNSVLPWKNSTTLPKLCQIRDNLHANYNAFLFPNQAWMKWEGDDGESNESQKKLVIQAYMENKVRASKYSTTVSRLIYDFIDTGNAFATTEWVNETKIDDRTGEEIVGYVGPKLVRISPYDIVFNPTAADFTKTPKIIRTVKTLGELKREVEEKPLNQEAKDMFNAAVSKSLNTRRAVASLDEADLNKDGNFQIDGFGSIKQYYESDYVEILTFYGDLYDVEGDKFYPNHIIKIIDRSYVISLAPNPSWFGHDGIRHVGWRLRQDNLYAMGPLDNLVGMQYRIDHLENLKADVFDMVAFPMLKVAGHVEEFDYGPNERIYVGEEGDVDFMHPDVTALNADTQIALLEQKMEEMAGAPREAMGFRTAGEKTAYEMQVLENGANRIFQNKAGYFESMMIETTLNDMLELSRRNMTQSDVVRTFDQETSAELFETITKEDIVAKGRIRPRGASLFIRKNNMLQNLTQLSNSSLMADPSISVHISGKKIAHLLEQLMDLEKYDIVQDNVRVMEQIQTQRITQSGTEVLEKEAAVGSLLDQEGFVDAENTQVTEDQTNGRQ
jgi:hypothetical protein